MAERLIFKVFYSPLKAFEEIAKGPNVRGLLFILPLTLLATAVSRAVIASKVLLAVEPNSYMALLATEMFGDYIASSLIEACSFFLVRWIVYGSVILIISKIFLKKNVSWKNLLIIVSYFFSVLIIYRLIDAFLFSMLPTVEVPVDRWPPAEEEIETVSALLNNAWLSTWSYQLEFFLLFAMNFWFLSLCIIALRPLYEIGWKKAAAVSLAAYGVYFLVLGPL